MNRLRSEPNERMNERMNERTTPEAASNARELINLIYKERNERSQQNGVEPQRTNPHRLTALPSDRQLITCHGERLFRLFDSDEGKYEELKRQIKQFFSISTPFGSVISCMTLSGNDGKADRVVKGASGELSTCMA